MPQGQVSKWVNGAQEGLIMGDDGQEAPFALVDVADKSTEGSLAEGLRVEYDIRDAGNRLEGWNVRLLT